MTDFDELSDEQVQAMVDETVQSIVDGTFKATNTTGSMGNCTQVGGTNCPSGPPGIAGPPGASLGTTIIGGGTISNVHGLTITGSQVLTWLGGGGGSTGVSSSVLVNNGMGQLGFSDMYTSCKAKCKRCFFEANTNLGAFKDGCVGDTTLLAVCPECSIITFKKLGFSTMCVDDGATSYEWALLRIMRRMGFEKMIKEFGLEDEIEFLLTSQLRDLSDAASKYAIEQNLTIKP